MKRVYKINDIIIYKGWQYKIYDVWADENIDKDGVTLRPYDFNGFEIDLTIDELEQGLK